jgi:hypothetical protein
VLAVSGAMVSGTIPLRAQEVVSREDGRGANLPDALGSGNPIGQQASDARSPGSITGVVVDSAGVPVWDANITLTREHEPAARKTVSGSDGTFSFADVAPGPFTLTITATGFATRTASYALRPGEKLEVPRSQLTVAAAANDVRVTVTQQEAAQYEVKAEEQQRVLGVIPNFYVSYVANPVPLSSKQKFDLAWKTVIDPVNFAITGLVAGVEQANNNFSGYGQGAAGYGKRYGAAYADGFFGTMIGSAILPSVLKQDPRYFYKGMGSTKSRILYAIAMSVVCKGDNGHWQANYSAILGGLAAGGISNLYYPASSRDGVGLTFENAAIGTAATAAANILQEFVVRRLTPKARDSGPGTP